MLNDAPKVIENDGFDRFINAFIAIDKNLLEPKDLDNSLNIIFGANLIENSIDSKDVYMHPIELSVSDNSKFIKYEAGSEEGVALLLLEAFLNSKDSNEKEFIESLDIGYLSAESSFSEEEVEEIVALVTSNDEATIVVADDIYTHENVENIAAILATLSKYTNITVCALEPKVPFSLSGSEKSLKLQEPQYLPSYDGIVVYNTLSKSTNELLGSEQFALAAKVSDGEKLSFDIDGTVFEKNFKLDKTLKGTIAINPIDNLDILSSYRFKRIKINKVGS